MEDYNKDDVESGMVVEIPSSTGTDPPEKLATNNSGGLVDKIPGRLVYGRVKVKIKTSKAFDSQHTFPDVPTQSDTDNSSQQLGLEKLGIIGEKMEDKANALPEIKLDLLANVSKKAGSIKIKSSKGFGSSSLSPCYNSGLVQGERTHQKEPSLQLDSQYSQQKLDATLDVIKTVMKMDAAEPFNVPVNPIAQGIHGASVVESPCGEDTSSSVANSQEEDVDADMEDKGEEVKMEYTEQPYSPFQEKHEVEDNNITFQTKEEREIGDRSVKMESDNDIQNDPQEETSMHHEDENTAAQLHRPKELLDEDQKGKMYHNFRPFENPLILELCGALFVDNHKSIWGGAHSIDRRQGSTCVHNSIHAAVATFMK